MIRRPEVVLLDATAPAYVEELTGRFPEVSFIVCTSYDALRALAAEGRGQAVLATKVEPGPPPRDVLFKTGLFRWVHVGSAGIDHLGLWDMNRVMVTNSSGIHGDIMGQYVVMAVLNCNHMTALYARQQADRIWRKTDSVSIEGQSMCIVGFGHVGRDAGLIAQRVGMRVTGVRTRPSEPFQGITVVGLDDLKTAIGAADHVVLTLPLTPRTRGMIDTNVLSAMKPGAHLINVARGGIVDETALLAALDSGHIGQATMDVFAQEPLPADSRFWHHPRVTVTPHSASDIADYPQRVVALFQQNLRLWLAGRPLRNIVDPLRGY
jgi:phosphoglycerate dehydrogenase-like enzyme